MTVPSVTPAGTTPDDLTALARGVRLLLFDVDGVLTDGRILLHADGSESKSYHIRDGTGLVLSLIHISEPTRPY